MGNSNSIKAFASPCSDLVRDQELVKSQPKDTAQSVLELIGSRNFTSVPLEGGREVVGTLDILRHLVLHDFSDDAWSTPVREISTNTVFVTPSTTVKDAVHQMLEQRVYRVAVRPGEVGEISGLISQVDILRFIHKHLDDLVDTADERVASIDILGSSPVKSVGTSDSLREALELIARSNISAVAIVNPAGGFVAPLSRRNFATVSRKSLEGDLDTPVGQYVLAHAVARGSRATAEKTLRQVIEQMVELKLHRVFSVDDKDHPVKVISLSDIIRYLVTSSKPGSVWASEEDKAADISTLDSAIDEFKKTGKV